MKTLTACTDPGYQEPASPSRLDTWLAHYLQDKRDLPFAYLLLKLSATVLPLAGALFVPALAGWAWETVLAAFLYLSLLRYKGPFGLMLHCTSHRVLFKKRYGWLNHYIPWVIGPLFGQTPETYFVHHLGMHHPENNLPDDDSSTMFYQRDSVRGFLRYFGDFFVLAVGRLWGYLTRRNRLVLRRRLLRGELTYLAVALLLGWVNWPAAVAVFAVPFVLSRFIMMLGNWAQHHNEAREPRQLLHQQHHLPQYALQPPVLERWLPRRPPPAPRPALDRAPPALPPKPGLVRGQ